MCGFFAFSTGKSAREIAELFGVTNLPHSLKDIESLKYYPKSQIPTISKNSPNTFKMRYWSLIPKWWNKSPSELTFTTFNARSEEISEKATYKNAWKNGQRCLIPATWFYEFKKEKLQTEKTVSMPYRVEAEDAEIFTLAGLYETSEIDSTVFESVTILTCGSVGTLKPIHDRQPVIIKPRNRDIWLNQSSSLGEIEKLLLPDPTLAVQPIDPEFNKTFGENVTTEMVRGKA